MSFMNAVDTIETEVGRIDVMQADCLAGSTGADAAAQLFYIQQTGMRMKQLRLTLPSGGKARIEPGAIHSMHGALEIRASTGGGIMRGLQRKLMSGETMFVNEVHGHGEVWLEPSFGHFILMEIKDDAIVVDQGMFLACIGEIDIATERNSAVTALLGNEGWFQTKISGTGIVALFSPVPMSELREIHLNGSKASVDGNFAIMRTAGVQFSVQKSSRSWLATSVSGEGIFQTFTGTGTVWIAPTKGVYEALASPAGIKALLGPPGSRSTDVARGGK